MNIDESIKRELSLVLEHPFFNKLSNGEYTRKELRVFAEQYYLVSVAFIDFLLLGSIQIIDDSARRVFIENLYDEHGKGNHKGNHRLLLKRFLDALNCRSIDLIQPLEKTSIYIHGMRDLCRTGSQLEVLGALGPGCESFTVEQYSLIYDALNKHFDFKKEDLIFFASHITHDPKHTDDIDNEINRLAGSENKLLEVIIGAKKSIILEKILWDGIYEKCQDLTKSVIESPL